MKRKCVPYTGYKNEIEKEQGNKQNKKSKFPFRKANHPAYTHQFLLYHNLPNPKVAPSRSANVNKVRTKKKRMTERRERKHRSDPELKPFIGLK